MLSRTREEFEKNLQTAQNLCNYFPGDATIMTTCGRFLVGCPLEFSRDYDSSKLLQDGIEKLEAALQIDPEMHEALSWLGSAYTTKGSQALDDDDAKEYFDKADEYCGKAVALARETRFEIGGRSSADAAHGASGS